MLVHLQLDDRLIHCAIGVQSRLMKSRELKCAVYIVLQECQDSMGKPMDVSMAKPMELKVSMICMGNPMDISMAKAMEPKNNFFKVGGWQHQTT